MRPGASDATYHIMWIILFNALDDFGIREVNDLTRTGSPGNILPNTAHIENTKRKVMDEALHGATRIAGLVSGVFLFYSSPPLPPSSRALHADARPFAGRRPDIKWVSGTYGTRAAGRAMMMSSHSRPVQRLDSAVMHVSIIQAGTFLARLGRPEVMNCVSGLQQYSYAYEECAEQAAEIRRAYIQATTGDSDLNHMASVVRPLGDAGANSAMNVDQSPYAGGYRG